MKKERIIANEETVNILINNAKKTIADSECLLHDTELIKVCLLYTSDAADE